MEYFLLQHLNRTRRLKAAVEKGRGTNNPVKSTHTTTETPL